MICRIFWKSWERESQVYIGVDVLGSVSRKTDYLVYGSELEDGRAVNTSNKYKNAVKNGTRLLSEDQLSDLLMQSICLFIG